MEELKKSKITLALLTPRIKKANTYFIPLLSKKFEVKLGLNDPDIIIYDDLSKNMLKSINSDKTPIRIAFTGEPLPIDKKLCDFSLSFDETNTSNNYYLPLWVIFIDWFAQRHKMVHYEWLLRNKSFTMMNVNKPFFLRVCQ